MANFKKEKSEREKAVYFLILMMIVIYSAFVTAKNTIWHPFSQDFIYTKIAQSMDGQRKNIAPKYAYDENIYRQAVSTMNAMVNDILLVAVGYENEYWENLSGIHTLESKIPETLLETEDETEEAMELKSQETATQAVQTEANPGRTYSMSQLRDYHYVIRHFYTVDSTTTLTQKELQAEKMVKRDMTIKKDPSNPQILIYHTHGSEAFRNSKGKKDTVIGVGEILAKKLKDTYGYNVLHDQNIYDMRNGNLDRSKAYTYAGRAVEANLKKYPSIQVVIDIHRDSVSEKTHLVKKINGKQTAMIMFFNGMSRTAKNGDIAYLKNPNKEANLAFSLQMQLAAAKKYPGFTRKIYIKGYRYNLHVRERSLLIEVGAENNTYEEAQNAMEPLADLLNDVLTKK